MTKRLYMHVGAPKSGTTYLQAILEGNAKALASKGVLVVAADRRLERVHAAMAIREDSRLAKLPPEAAQAWDRLVAEIKAWPGDSAVCSYELFAAASAEKVARALAQLDGIEVHVVITARDLARAMPSAWQERLKFALTEPLLSFAPDQTMGARAQWGWRTMDPAGVAQRWGGSLPPRQVHIVTMPKQPASQHEFWERFADACAIDSQGLELDQVRVNESMGVVEAELLRRVNQTLAGRIATSRDQSVLLRDLFAHEILVPQGSEPIAISPEQYDEATERANQAIAELSESGVNVHGDLDDLRATRVAGRTPDEVSDSELLEVALESISRLLLRVKDSSVGMPGATEATSASVPRRLVRALSAPVVEAKRRRLEKRVEGLEELIHQRRLLEQRVAELSDLVAELLMPALGSDGSITGEDLESYRRDSL
ncbi:MAG TPA: hypothetical protein P5108_03100 [Marmoricola sp.]|nr:hypothetical protein [Nocardioidaceae bacterium]HRV68412.1 hypothetical protein [Marmoricola sp.]